MPPTDLTVSKELAGLIQEVKPAPRRCMDPDLRERADALTAEITGLYEACLRDGSVELNDAQLEGVVGGRLDATSMLLLLATSLSVPVTDAGAYFGVAGVVGTAAFVGSGIVGPKIETVAQQQSPDPAWMRPALSIIKEFEGLEHKAYVDAVGVVTIGWGTTHYSNGKPVKMGDRVSTKEAETLLRDQVLREYAPGLFEALPMAKGFSEKQQAALISFTYNVGVEALKQSTLCKRLHAGEQPEVVIKQELPRWRFGDNGNSLAGLVRRRAAEVSLFCS